MSDVFRSLAVGLEFHDGAAFRACVAKGGAIGDLDRAGWRTKPFDEFADLLVHARRVRGTCREHNKGWFTEQLHEFDRRLDRRQVEGAGTAWDQDKIGNFDRGTRGAVGMRRSIDDDKIGPLPSRLRNLGRESWRWAVDHFRRCVLAPSCPLAGSRLGVGIYDERNAPRVMGGSGKVKRQRRLARASLLADYCDSRHVGSPTCLHRDNATLLTEISVFGYNACTPRPHFFRGEGRQNR